jgi:hypothetical protein
MVHEDTTAGDALSLPKLERHTESAIRAQGAVSRDTPPVKDAAGIVTVMRTPKCRRTRL